MPLIFDSSIPLVQTIALHTPPELLLDDWDVTWKRDFAEQLPKEGNNVIMNFCTVLPFAKCALKVWCVFAAQVMRLQLRRSRNCISPLPIFVAPFAPVISVSFQASVGQQHHVYGPPKVYNQFEEVVCVILLKSLDLLGYFTHPPQQKPLGTDESGTSLFAEALSDVHWRYAEQGVLFIELIRTGALNCQAFKPPYSNPRY